jgi:hypothetical protein
MVMASKHRDGPHARIYEKWLTLPTWRALSLAARSLLVEILARYRPGDNGKLAWSVRQAAQVLGVSKSTAARALTELELNGWIAVATVSAFGGKAKPATYTLTMYPDDVTGDPASRAFESLPGNSSRARCRARPSPQSQKGDKAVLPVGRDGFAGGTSQSHPGDNAGDGHLRRADDPV